MRARVSPEMQPKVFLCQMPFLVAGLQEVRWLDSGEVSIGDTAFIWSGRNYGKHQEGVALEDQTLEAMWGHYKSALDFAAREVLGKRLCAKKPWISQATRYY